MGEEEKKNALGESWGSDKGLKGDGGGCVQVSGSHWSAESDSL